MDEIDKLQLLAELDEENCGLNHGPDTHEQDYMATDYIVLPFGFKKNDIEEIAVRELIIPVCYECALALTRNEWTLLYCVECAQSRWVCRQYAKNQYRHHVLWLKGCPDCSQTFRGLYFHDEDKIVNDAHLLLNKVVLMAA